MKPQHLGIFYSNKNSERRNTGGLTKKDYDLIYIW